MTEAPYFEFEVWRRCRQCDQWKPLTHYFLYMGNQFPGHRANAVREDVKVCASCRGADYRAKYRANHW